MPASHCNNVPTSFGREMDLPPLKMPSSTESCDGNNNPSPTGVDEWHVIQENDNIDDDIDVDDMSISNASMSASISMSIQSEFDFSSDDSDGEEGKAISRGGALSRSFDMKILRDSIENGEDTLKHVVGKDVVLVIGKTGTGKSTLIQGISGKCLYSTVHTTEKYGQVVEKQVFEAKEAMAGFEIGHVKTSMTKCINCYIHQQDHTTGDGVVYLDSPGFEDTSGPEIDIATSVMLSQVATKCRSLRFVILINYASLIEDRGGAIRTVLKFIRGFVQDFNSEKQSFMFLFTHIDEIRGIPLDSIEGAKEHLKAEIIRTADGTTDTDVLALLDFMRKSLKKNFPFVDIFHPLKMDYSKLANLIETKLKPVTNPTLAGSCGLTRSSQLTLSAELHSLLRNLRLLLNDISPDMEMLTEMKKMFRYFHLYIDFSDVRKAVSESRDLFENHIKRQNEVIDAEINRGTRTDLEFTTSNVQLLKSSIEKLIALSDGSQAHIESVYQRMTFEVERFQKEIILKKGSSFHGLHQKLGKLRTWCTGFDKFTCLYQKTHTHIMGLIFNTTTDVVTYDIIKNLESAPLDELQYHIRNIQVLKSINENSEQLSIYQLVHINGAVDAYHKFEKYIKLTLISWRRETSNDMKVTKIDCTVFELIASRTGKMERLQGLLEESLLCLHLSKEIEHLCNDLEAHTVEQYKDKCSKFKELSPKCQLEWMSHIKSIKYISTLFENMKGRRWIEMSSEYLSSVEHIKLVLKTKSGELEEISQTTYKHGMRNGARDGNALAYFLACKWFDDFLSKEDRFVANCCNKIEYTFKERTDQVMQKATTLITDLFADPQDSLKILILDLKGVILELHSISKFGSVLGDEHLSKAESTTRSKLNEYIDKIETTTRSHLSYWVQSSEKKESVSTIFTATENLNNDLYKIELLRTIDSEYVERLDTIKATVHHSLDSFTEKAQGILSSEGDYHLKADYLSIIENLGILSHTKLHLPELEKVKNDVRALVSAKAREIEKLVEETSEWDDIDQRLRQLEKATILDKFISHEASSRLRPLRQLREQKETNVDDLLHDLIRAKNFNGMREFLVPFTKSKDQLKKQKFDQYQAMICSSLKESIDDLHVHLSCSSISEATARKIIRDFDVLNDASSELGNHITTKLRLEYEIQTAKKKLNWHLRGLVQLMKAGAKELDFVKLSTNKHLVTMLSELARAYVSQITEKELKEATPIYDNTIKSVETHMNKFFDSCFNEGSMLLDILSGLKVAHESRDPNLKDLSDLYQTNKEVLAKKLNEAVSTIHDGVSQTQCFDDAIATLHELVQLLARGLDDHISSTALQFDCKNLLDKWRIENQEINRSMEFDGVNAKEKLDEWAESLNRLYPPSFIGKVYSLVGGNTTYNNRRKRLIEIVASRFSNGRKAVQSRDYILVQECIHILELISQKVGKHVDMASARLEDLKSTTLNSFLRLCKHAQKGLNSGNSRQLEGTFREYKSFVLNVTFIMTSIEAKKSYNLTNQLIFETFDKDISQLEGIVQSFDFGKIKSKIEHVRHFGGFLADRCTLFYEELKCCEHVKPDKWLEKVWTLCFTHFSCGRDLSRIKYYAILGVLPSASKAEVKKAFKEKAKIWHPDKCKNGVRDSDAGAMFRKIKEASDELENAAKQTKDISQPFDDLLQGIQSLLRKCVQEYLSEQRYELVDMLLFQMKGLSMLDSLVNPILNSTATEIEIRDLVKSHVKKAKVEVNSNWSERNYKALNENITDLKLMESNFKGYPSIFPTSWNDGILKSIESEIESLASKARSYLTSRTVAKENQNNFRSLFISMGYVLIELPSLKDFTKNIMCNVLKCCLASDWGYSYLFELGLSLQRSGENGDEDSDRVGQVLVAEFNHFKEVMTMVWNEETTQKPPEDTICNIRGEVHTQSSPKRLAIDRDQLLMSFRVFDENYKSLLGEYIKPEADLNALVQKTMDIAKKVKPLSCSSGWGSKLKAELPKILAGVFALFTILKSGESFNRIETAVDALGDFKGETLLMKPHNIQVMTILCMLGCGAPSHSSLVSQLMQIRTGEGKSMILGATAVVLGLLGFRVRCVCYSEYLSNRDYDLFRDVFDHFNVLNFIKYSKITTFSEDTTAYKGDIRKLTTSLLRSNMKTRVDTLSSSNSILHNGDKKKAQGNQIEATDSGLKLTSTKKKAKKRCKNTELLSHHSDSILHNGDKKKAQGNKIEATESGLKLTSTKKKAKRRCKNTELLSHYTQEEILLVDEVDVFFSSEFLGQTHNQVTQLREPEVGEILRDIWASYKRGGRRQRLADVKAISAYGHLVQKFPRYAFLLDNEISLMLDQVRHVDDEPYFLDTSSDRIGYKVMDTISYEATYGYRTIFAYLNEADKGNLRSRDTTLANVLIMPVSCGQFSYANISPARILGVSGTLGVMGTFEKDIMSNYGLSTYLYVPSVYGQSNFQFDKAGEGIHIESSTSDFFLKITDEIKKATNQKRAVIIFFRDNMHMNEYTSSAFYRKLGRQKKLLTECMSATDKEFVINKAATAGQITICSAVFGRGTDFFCKDERVQKSGGVHIIQTFLSEECCEEIQIQGRTARQGKKGSYQMVLLESDLEEDFGLPHGEKNKIAKQDHYKWLCKARIDKRKSYCETIKTNLTGAAEQDRFTHTYFDALLNANKNKAHDLFKELYLSIKKRPMPSTMDLDLSFVIDVTGSMGPYARTAAMIIKNLVKGKSSVISKMNHKFPDLEIKLRIGVLGFRDIDDQSDQFMECIWHNGHFTESIRHALHFVDEVTSNPSGGGDLAEDHLGAIKRCADWKSRGDWASSIKCMMLLTDAPAHGLVSPTSAGFANADSYKLRHPKGLTTKAVIDTLISKDINLFVCSFNPVATSTTEQELSQQYFEHPDNTEGHEVTIIPMVQVQEQHSIDNLGEGHGKHIIFALDESGSMSHNWAGVVEAYNQYILRRKQSQRDFDLVSVVQFSSSSRITVQMKPISQAPKDLDFVGHGTRFLPAAVEARHLIQKTPSSHVPVVIFMSDGATNDADKAAREFKLMNHKVKERLGSDLELHVIAFGSGASQAQLQTIASTSRSGKVYTSADTTDLSNIFVDIAGGEVVAELLEAEIGRRISETVTDKLLLEYME